MAFVAIHRCVGGGGGGEGEALLCLPLMLLWERQASLLLLAQPAATSLGLHARAKGVQNSSSGPYQWAGQWLSCLGCEPLLQDLSAQWLVALLGFMGSSSPSICWATSLPPALYAKDMAGVTSLHCLTCRGFQRAAEAAEARLEGAIESSCSSLAPVQ